GRPMVMGVASLVVLVAAVAAIITGPDLRWDQLALRSVRVGTNVEGVFWGSLSVKWVLRGFHEVSLGDYRRTVWLHVLLFPVLAWGGIGGLWYACSGDGEGTESTQDVSEERA